ncbi:PQQ-binding-like beta-propeller repeat protein [Phenylobacterium sp. J367]|uniref:outer membrane protein assembly factor BamB family protein n=1 Tax=Phenylobacterium sp. J367 TaxID=2898435 RepID=UPI00215154A1|nr:PQQ-binding-like beta-propeller repeat protein [Phenylobacterium sp. J367]MCR5879890.1 PQQ-binding-like beta-propeller repeat protein [Phenylobacterium sp. J367]
MPPMPTARAAAVLSLLAAAACSPAGRAPVAPVADADWAFYGGDAGGQRYSSAAQITPANVKGLKVAWTYSNGEATSHADFMDQSSLQVTPIMAGGRLYACSSFNAVSAHDPGSGREIWRFDPKVDPDVNYPNDYVCRGVTYWRDPAAPAGAACAERIYAPTADRRLIALDAATGKLCAGFGSLGVVHVGDGVKLAREGAMQITSPPVIARGRDRHRLVDRRQPAGGRGPRHGKGLRRAHRPAALDLRSARRRGARGPRRGRQRLGADVGRRGARPGLPADVEPQPGLLGRRAGR